MPYIAIQKLLLTVIRNNEKIAIFEWYTFENDWDFRKILRLIEKKDISGVTRYTKVVSV